MRDMQTADVSAYPVMAQRHKVGDFAVEALRPVGAPGPLPVVLYLHGGGWVLGDAQTHARMMREIVAQSQAAVLFVEYGCAPEFPFPLPLEHCYQALEWVAAKGDNSGLEPFALRWQAIARAEIYGRAGVARKGAEWPGDSFAGDAVSGDGL